MFAVWSCKPESTDQAHKDCSMFLSVLHPLEGTIVLPIAEFLLNLLGKTIA